MSQMIDLQHRITELETRLAFHEHASQQLSDALAEARADIARHARALERMAEELQAARGAGVSANAADEPPPPHW